MATIDADLPTLPQVFQLASLIPASSNPPSALPLLLPFIDLVRPPWLQNFLFTLEPMHLDHFLSPTFPSRVFVSSASTTRIEPPNLPSSFDETHHCLSRTLYLPSLTLPHLTLGFGAWEVVSRSGAFWNRRNRSSPDQCGACLPLRFIRDTQNNLLAEFVDVPVKDTAMIFLTKYISPTHTHVVTALFSRSKMKAALAADKPDAVVDALEFIASEHHTRTCTNCPPSSLPNQNCMCMPSTQLTAAHPFDNSTFAATMLPHLGVHYSASDKLLFDRGTIKRHVMTGTRMQAQGVIDPLFVKRIVAWAATGYISATARDPHSGMAPLLSFHVRALGDIFTLPNNMVEFADKNASKKAKGVETDGGTNDEEVLQYLIDDQLQRQDNQTASVMADVEDLDDALDITQLGVGDGLGVEGLPDAPNINPGYIFTLTSSNTAPAPTDEGHEDWWATRCEEEIPLSSSTGPFLESEQDASTMVFKDRVLSEFGSSSISNSNASVRGEALEPKAAARTKEDMNSDEKLRAKRLKAQERREKNRLCAQRSNRRAKAIRDGLKTDLKMSKEKVEILRAKEMALRQVNLELRRAVTEHPN